MSHERVERALKMNCAQVEWRTGIYSKTVADKEAVLLQCEGEKKKTGHPAALNPVEQLLLTPK